MFNPTPVLPQVRFSLSDLLFENVSHRMRFMAKRPGVWLRQTPELYMLRTGLAYPSGFLNFIISRERGVPTVANMRDWFGDTGALTWLKQQADPALEDAGLVHEGYVHSMSASLINVNLHRPLPDNLNIIRVHRDEQLWDFCRVLSSDHPDVSDEAVRRWYEFELSLGLGENSLWQRFVGYQSGKPVATSAVYLSTHAAGIYHVATVPEARGQGFGKAVTRAAMAEGWLRARLFSVLIATHMGLPLYQSLGFEIIERFHAYERR